MCLNHKGTKAHNVKRCWCFQFYMTFYDFYSFGTSPQCDKVLCIHFTTLKRSSYSTRFGEIKNFYVKLTQLKMLLMASQ